MKWNPMRHWLIAACVLVATDLILCTMLGALHQDEKVVLRNLLFSDIYADRDLPTSAALNERLDKLFKRDRDPTAYLKYLNPVKAAELLALSKRSGITDRELAVAITQHLGSLSDGRVCGIESLGRIVFDTEKGVGCCSDFSKAWTFYAIYVGMTVREVNSINHTTVEYLDRNTGAWQWIDPYNRIEIMQAAQPISQYDIRRSSLFASLEFKRMNSGDPDFDVRNYVGYSPSQLSVLMWRTGTNFLEVDRWDRAIQSVGLPKSMRQAILLTLGIQPKWVMLTTNSLAGQLRMLQALLYFCILALVLLNIGFAILLRRKIAWYTGLHALGGRGSHQVFPGSTSSKAI